MRIFPPERELKNPIELEKFTELKLNLGKILQGFSFKSLLGDGELAKGCNPSPKFFLNFAYDAGGLESIVRVLGGRREFFASFLGKKKSLVGCLSVLFLEFLSNRRFFKGADIDIINNCPGMVFGQCRILFLLF